MSINFGRCLCRSFWLAPKWEIDGEQARVNFMVTPCINNIQHFNFQLMHTTLKNIVIRTF